MTSVPATPEAPAAALAPHASPAYPKRRILIIRRENIGDLILTTPLIRVLRERLPDAFIAVWVNSYNAPVLAGNPDVDRVHVYTKGKHTESWIGRLAARWRQAQQLLELRAAKFHDVILAEPTYTPRNIRFAKFILGGRPDTRVVGFEHDDGASEGLDVVAQKLGIETLHQAQIMMRLARAYGASGHGSGGEPAATDAEAPACKVVPPRGVSTAVVAGQPLRIGLHLSARKPSQRWPMERFAALAVRLHREYRCEVRLFWSPGAPDNALHPGDDDKAAALRAAVAREDPNARQWLQPAPTTDLSSLIAKLGVVDLVVCADGGAMHIAAALGKPIVALFGDSDPVHWRPWRVPQRVLQVPSRDVADLTVDDVAVAVDGLLRECGLVPAKHA
jgi:heptosyltransferase-3